MMPRKRSRAAGSSRAGPCSVSMKPVERRERRAQLVADVGDEVGAHLLDPPDRRQVMHRDDQIPARPVRGQRDRRNERLRPARRRQPRRRTRRAATLPVAPAVRIASTSSGVRSAIEAGSPRRSAGASAVGLRVERDDAAVVIEHDNRIGHPGNDGVEQGSRRRRLRPGAPAARAGERACRGLLRAAQQAAEPADPAWPRRRHRSPTSRRLAKVQHDFADAQHRQRQRERQDVIQQPEDQQAGQQFLGVVLPERDQHGGVEHAEPAGRMAGEAEQRRGDEDHRDVDELRCAARSAPACTSPARSS